VLIACGILVCVLALLVVLVREFDVGRHGTWSSLARGKLVCVGAMVALAVWRFGYLAPCKGKVRGKEVDITPKVYVVLMVPGILSLCVGSVGAVIGISRGYSLQSRWGEIALGIGLLCLTAAFAATGKKVHLLAVITTAMLLTMGWGFQGRYYYGGSSDHGRGMYGKAAEKYRSEMRAWYLRIAHNPYEGKAAEELVMAYCRRGRYDAAREVYELIVRRYPREYARRLGRRLQETGSFGIVTGDAEPEAGGKAFISE